MKRKIFLLIIAATLCAAHAFARDGRVDFVAADGRFVIFGDYTKLFQAGERVRVSRDGRAVGVGEVKTVYPTYIMFATFSMEGGAAVSLGDLVERIETRKTGLTVTDSMIAKPARALARIEKISGDELISYGDFSGKEFKQRALVEIIRDGMVIGAAELLEAGTHLARFRMVGAAGGKAQVGDFIRVPDELLGQTASEMPEVKAKKKKPEATEEEEQEQAEEPAKKPDAEKTEKQKIPESGNKTDPIEKRLEALRKK